MLCPECRRESSPEAVFCMSCGTELAKAEPPAAITTASIGLSPGFVGRQREMAELVAALDDALAGHGRLVMLGESPVKKRAIVSDSKPTPTTQFSSLGRL